MFTLLTVASAAPTMARSVRHWIYQLGGLGFIPLGLLDSSVIPLPGSMDVLTIFLSARHKQLWFYYASMATVGSVIGGFVTYRLARKGGKETLARRFPPRRLEKVTRPSSVGAWARSPFPPCCLHRCPCCHFCSPRAQCNIPLRKFLFALTLGRIVRYTLLAFMAARYGRQILAFISRHGHPALFIIVGLIATAAAVLFLIFAGKRQDRPQKQFSE
jgi:membrane protein YqaA with SNARE-associated domain